MPRSFRAFDQRKPRPQTSPQVDISWPRDELLAIARLLDRLAPPDHHNPERYFEQKSALSLARQLRRLAHHSA